jgi:hypothetical protein
VLPSGCKPAECLSEALLGSIPSPAFPLSFPRVPSLSYMLGENVTRMGSR